jgi:ABC-2 type transport system permease protein
MSLDTMTDLGPLMRAEWVKLRSLRSTSWTVGAMLAVTVGLSVLLCAVAGHDYATASAADKATWDPTNQALAGCIFGQLAIGVFGVLAITAEYASGTIRTSVAATPRRTPLLVAKAIVYGGVALVVGELICLAAFFVGQLILAGHAPHATIGQPGVIRAILFAGVYLSVICLISLGAGFVLRNTAGAITAVVAVLLVVPGIFGALPVSLQNSVGMYLPVQIAGDSLAAVVPEPHALSPAAGMGMLLVYVAGALAVARWTLLRRDV